MKKAFIFDMDGVIVDSESLWKQYEEVFLPYIFGKNIYSKMKNEILGSTLTRIYDLAYKYGFQMNKKEFIKQYDSYAKIIYKKAKITPDVESLIDKLIEMDFNLGLVSSSRRLWINLVLAKIKQRANKFQYILSLNDKGIPSKPSPDGYLKTIKMLNATPRSTIILEDSKRGVKAAKASGALTICLKENIPSGGHIPTDADIYVETVKDLTKQIDTINI